jgi:type I restriction enzyme M protein
MKSLSGVAGFLLANGALGDGDAFEIRKKLIEKDKVEAIIILPRELFISTDISVTFWILNQNKRGGSYHGREQRDRRGEILFMDLRRWTENPVKSEQKKKVQLSAEQIQRVADIYRTWQAVGTDGTNYAEPELYRSVGIEEIRQNNWTLVPSKYIEFVDHDLEIDYPREMARIQKELRELLAIEKQSQKMLEEAFKGIGYGIEEV